MYNLCSVLRLCSFVSHKMSMNYKMYLFLLVVTFGFACKQRPGADIIPIDDLFKSQDKRNYHVSPDGETLSYLKLEGKSLNLYVEDIASGEARQITHLNEKNIFFHFWVNNNELVYYKEVDASKYLSDIFIVDKFGKHERQLSKSGTSKLKIPEDQVLIDDKFLMVYSNKRDSTAFDVYRMNVRDGNMEMVAKNSGNIVGWNTDSEGKLRLAVSSDGVNTTILYRSHEEAEFKPVMTTSFTTIFKPVAFLHDRPNIIYAISNVKRDKCALVEVDCNTGKELKVLFGNDSINVTDAQYSRRRHKMSFAIYESWKNEKHYLDDSIKLLYEDLDRLLPNTETRIIDRDKNENVFVIRTITDRNPGSYYLYFADKRKLRKLSDFNPAIRLEDMSEMKPVSFKSRDGLTIHGYLTLPLRGSTQRLPVIVLPHARAGSRDSWGYNAEVQFFANRGYAVFQVNYRGSSGYGKAFASAGFKQWGAKIQDDIDDGVKWLIDQKIADPRRIGVYGSSFGGNIALNCAWRNPKMYVCAASNSGIINLFAYLKSIPPYSKTQLQLFYEIVGDPLKDVDQMRMASPLFQADKINIPVFIAQNSKDYYTNLGDALQLVKNLNKRGVKMKYLQNEGLYLGGNQEARQEFYTGLEQFFETNLKKR